METPAAISSIHDFGTVIQTRRRALKLRQQDLSALSGVDQSNLSKIERGQIPATLETCLRILGPLGLDLQAVSRE